MSIWAKAVNTSVYILNISAIANMIPHHAYSDKKLPVSHMRVLGCDCCVHVLNVQKAKCDP